MYKSVPTPCCLIWAADLPVEQMVAVNINCTTFKIAIKESEQICTVEIFI